MALSDVLKRALAVAFGVNGDAMATELSDAIDSAGDVGAAEVNLADGKVLIGGVDGNAAEKTLSGDVTVTREGVVAIGAKKVVEAMIALANHKIFIGDATGAAAAMPVTGDVTIGDDGVTAIGAGKVTEAMLVVGAAGTGLSGLIVKFLANIGVIGAIPVVHKITIADASADTDVVFTHKTEILDAWFDNTGIAAHATLDTIQLKNGATAITDAAAKTATVEARRRFLTIAAAQRTILAAGTLRVTAVKNTNAAVVVYILGARVA